MTIHTQTVENYYSVFKRGMRGTYQHCARKHLHRYCAEFDFRYSNRSALGVDDVARSEALLRGVKGRRLTYKGPRSGRADAENTRVSESGDLNGDANHASVAVMPKKKEPDPKEKPQKKRFIEFAREVGADDDDEALERGFKKVALKDMSKLNYSRRDRFVTTDPDDIIPLSDEEVERRKKAAAQRNAKERKND